jgi:hypothetical protein
MEGQSFQDGMSVMPSEKAILCISELNQQFEKIQRGLESEKACISKLDGRHYNKMKSYFQQLIQIKSSVRKIFVYDKFDREVFVNLQNRLYKAITNTETLLEDELGKFQSESG